MAILPRTLLTQPAPAAVAAVTLFGLTVMGTAAWKTAQVERFDAKYESPCSAVEDSLGMKQLWNESSWVKYSYCFEQKNDHRAAAGVANAGLRYHPESEALYNIKAYNLIEAREHHEAADTLETGLRVIETPSNGIMENNLAWSYLYTGEGGTLKARGLYQSSLDRQPLCETLHTGMFVEFEIARSSSGLARAEALRTFQSLRNRYQVCENRDGEWLTVVEAIGAATLHNEVERMLGSQWQEQTNATLRGALDSIRSEHAATSVELVCEEAVPQADLRDECQTLVMRGLREGNTQIDW